jgi:membrane fusion protein, copper/silver efflux system
MRRVSLAIAAVLTLVASYAIGRHQASSHNRPDKGRRLLYYVDPMHPAYKSKTPGIAPDCGMKLEAVYAEDVSRVSASSPAAQLPAGSISVDGATKQLLGIRTANVEKGSVRRTLHVVGRVAPEDTRVYQVNSGTDGFIRETYNDSVGTLVKKDQKLAVMYAPDFLAVASGFLAAIQHVPGALGTDGGHTAAFHSTLTRQGVNSLEGYTDRLRNLGMSDVQINRMAKNHLLPETVDIAAPAEGFIIARNITAGQHFSRYAEFYRIADLRRVWVTAEVYQQDAPYLAPGGHAQIVLPNKERRLPARITDSLPESEVGGESVKLRLEVANHGFVLRPDMIVDVELPVQMPRAITVPLDALVDSGSHARVYVEESGGVFTPREVETGWRFGNRVEILHGVQPGERVVSAATFLVDSESRLKEPDDRPRATDNTGRMTSASESTAPSKMASDPSCGMRVDTARAVATGNTVGYAGTTYYFCSQHCKQAFQNHPVASLIRHKGEAD